MTQRIISALREARRARALTQAELAGRVGISPQALRAIEAGRAVPATDVALRLGRVLGRPVEALFRLPETDELAVVAEGPLVPGTRVQLAEIDGRVVARPLRGERGLGRVLPRADGVATGAGAVRVFGPAADVARRLVVVGCDPAILLIGDALARSPARVDLHWDERGSRAALGAIARGEAHVAGCHLLDEASGTFNRRFVEELVPFPCSLVTFSVWEEGIVVAPGNPRRIRSLADLARPGVRIVNREAGAASRLLLDREFTRLGIEPTAVAGYDTVASGHLGVAEAVAQGWADAGIAIKAAALALGLEFILLQRERYDLVIPNRHLGHPGVTALLDLLGRRDIRREIEALGGYDVAPMGGIVS